MQADVNILLSQMQGVRAFIVYRLVPGTDRHGNPTLDKVPTSPATGYECSPHNPNEWLLPDEAAAWARHMGTDFGVGLVISEQIVLPGGWRTFCLDLDKCRDGDRWAAHAAHFCAMFPGALIESSVSGLGLHVYGLYHGERPSHGVKNKVYRMELYTRLRFIALGVGASGSILTDHTTALHALARDYFPPRDDGDYGDTLTESPVPEWSGPTDDDALIAIGMRIKTARQVFGGKASFADLFSGNVDALARAFPPFKNTAYDESAADLALANSLAWLTGNHGERIERIMRLSQLVRPKWDRPSYMVNTINMACASQKSWYNDRRGAQSLPTTPPASAAMTAPATVAGTVPATDSAVGAVSPGALQPYPPNHIGELLVLPQQLYLFTGCMYVEDVYEMMLPDGTMLSSERFDVRYSGYKYCIDPENKTTRSAWEAFTRSEIYNFPKVRGVFFDPRKAPLSVEHREGHTYVNSWMPIQIERRQGDPTPLLRHLKKILPNGNDAEILLAYMAACVQYPGVKFQYWPLIQGVEGNGKTILSELLQAAIGRKYCHWPKAAELGSKFNAPFYGKLLILVEDVKISESRESLWETLKPMITGKQLEIEAKGVDKVTREICFNGVLNTNHKNGIRKTQNDRRICPFYCAQQYKSDLQRDGLTHAYFKEFRAWMENGGFEIVSDFLMTYEIPEQWNPADGKHAPDTTVSQEAITEGLGYIEQEILEAIQQKAPGFRNGWASSTALDILLGRLGKSSTIPRNKRRDLLEALGYSFHPALPDGRTPVADTDGNYPLLYIRKDAQGATETDARRVIEWFKWSQTV